MQSRAFLEAAFLFNTRKCRQNASGLQCCRSYSSGDIRKSGGSFGKKEQAQEEQYFRQKEREEIEQYRKELLLKKQSVSDASKKGKEATRK